MDYFLIFPDEAARKYLTSSATPSFPASVTLNNSRFQTVTVTAFLPPSLLYSTFKATNNLLIFTYPRLAFSHADSRTTLQWGGE